MNASGFFVLPVHLVVTTGNLSVSASISNQFRSLFSEKYVLVMNPVFFLSLQYGNPVTQEVLIAIIQAFEVWPAAEEVVHRQVFCNGDVWRIIGIFFYQFFKDLADRRFVNDVHIHRSF